jgi:hypothetical protein
MVTKKQETFNLADRQEEAKERLAFLSEYLEKQNFKLNTVMSREDDSKTLKISICDGLQKYLQMLIATKKDGEPFKETRDVYISEKCILPRYLVKAFLRNKLGDFEYSDILFTKDLVDNKSVDIELTEMSTALVIKENLTKAISKMVEVEIQFTQISTLEEIGLSVEDLPKPSTA